MRKRQIHCGRERKRERWRQRESVSSESAVQLDLTGFYMGLLPVDFTNSVHIHLKRKTATTCSV